MLPKLSSNDESNIYKYVPKLQRIINSTIPRITKFSAFALMTCGKLKDSVLQDIKIILELQYTECIIEERQIVRNEAKKNTHNL